MRAVGHLSLALLGIAVACVVALHVIRPRVSPIERRLSEYALGPYGWLMDTAFTATAGGLTALAIFLTRSAGRPRLVPAALVVAAVALVLSAIYRLDATDNADDVFHKWASGTAAAAVVVAALGWSVVGAGRRRPWRRGPDLLLAIVALGLAVLGLMLHETYLTGINQRLVWAALIAWSVVVTMTELASTGGTAPASTHPSVTSHPTRSKPLTTLNNHRPSRPKSTEQGTSEPPANPGAFQLGVRRRA